MPDNHQLSVYVPLKADALRRLADLEKPMGGPALVTLGADDIEALAAAGHIGSNPRRSLVHRIARGGGLYYDLEWYELNELHHRLRVQYCEENPGCGYDEVRDADLMPLDKAGLLLKLAAACSNYDCDRIDPEANGTTVTRKMAELGLTADDIFEVSEE